MGSGASTNNKTAVRPKPSETNGPSSSNSGIENDDKAARINGADTENQKEENEKVSVKIPPPCPPVTRKVQVFTKVLFKDVDKKVLKAPKDLMVKPFPELIQYLTEGASNDVAKVRAIFQWIASIDIHGMGMDSLPPQKTPLEYLLKIKWNMGNHAHLFFSLCRLAQLPCVIVNGINKSAAYEIGRPVDKRRMAAQWNAVYVDGEWRLMDVFWASSCVVGRTSKEWTLLDIDGKIVSDDRDDYEEGDEEGETHHRINEFYFMPDPDQFIFTHFPNDQKWQLLEKPLTVDEFGQSMYAREMFWNLGLKLAPNSLKTCMVKSNNGEIDIPFELPALDAINVKFRYMLYRKAGGSVAGGQMDRFVFYTRQGKTLNYNIRFPVAGTFRLDIFGQDITKHDSLDLCCAYVIECPEPKRNVEPLPDNPVIGWGPGAETEDAGMTPLTHDCGLVETEDGCVEMKFRLKKDVSLLQSLLSNKMDEKVLENFVISRVENGEAFVTVRLPKKGEYALKLFANDRNDEGDIPNVCNYLIRCLNDKVKNEPYPHVHNGALGKGNFASKLGVVPLNYPGGLIETDDGQCTLQFRAPKGVELFCEIHSAGLDDSAFENCLRKTGPNAGGETSLEITLPKAGEYSASIYARRTEDPDRIYNVHNYLIISKADRSDADVSNKGLNEKPEMPDVDKPKVTHKGTVEIRLPKSFENLMAELQKKNSNDPVKTQQVTLREDGGEYIVRIEVPDEGEYLLTLFEHTESGALSNLGTYTVYSEPMASAPVIVVSQEDKPGYGEQSSDKDELESRISEQSEEPPPVTNQMSAEEKKKLEEEKKLANEELHCSHNDDPDIETIPLMELPPNDVGKTENVQEDRSVPQTTPFLSEEDERKLRELEEEKKREEQEKQRRKEAKKALAEKRRMLNSKLKLAMESKDPNELAVAIKEFEDSGFPDNKNNLEKAKKMLMLLKAKSDLVTAMSVREVDVLERAIEAGEAANYNKSLNLELAYAKRVLEHLRHIEKLRHDILNLDQKTIAEIRSYSNPPDAVHQVMAASYLLLGLTEDQVKEWRSVQAFMGKTGRESLKRKVSQFNVEKLAVDVALRAKEIMARFSKEEVHDVSAGAATFYVWAQGMIAECESRFTESGGDLSTVRPKTARGKSAFGERKPKDQPTQGWA
ncbi:uncharacterized protein LOC106169650 isoform X2 [Lingula anatina]|uniref:Uncharacterized protein LOC106169650 isoform X2 n=1 Tax=Lingula anatina TaxID=7574 RepID=A0A1S3J2J7_LINAN|nr:uncharacterized protein LOC106169650 isoform X2 [Lingula anatina]|eukprot:XP_013404637.1 uncharacterized protein LOC106169650 isoform X2 [Lingula anatina]